MFRLWCVLIGYALGNIQSAYIIGKIRGIDIREYGSGNAGTTNTLRVLGKRMAAICLAGDMIKVFIAFLITYFLFRESYSDSIYVIRIYTALGCVLGHDYPFYLKFKGGKGIACLGAMMFAFYWPIIPGQLIIFFGIFFLTHYVSLASMFLVFGFLAQLIIFGSAGYLNMSEMSLLELYSVVIFLIILTLFQHRNNIWRLFHDEERKTYLKGNSERASVPIQGKELNVMSKEELNPEATPTVMPVKIKKKKKKEKSRFVAPVKTEREEIPEEEPEKEKEYKPSKKQKKYIENKEKELEKEVNPIQISLEEHNEIIYKNIDELDSGVKEQIKATKFVYDKGEDDE